MEQLLRFYYVFSLKTYTFQHKMFPTIQSSIELSHSHKSFLYQKNHEIISHSKPSSMESSFIMILSKLNGIRTTNCNLLDNDLWASWSLDLVVDCNSFTFDRNKISRGEKIAIKYFTCSDCNEYKNE